uniref:Uncharacterized protein LOC114334785 n=1 Tax=Diabrotica virgifera virgifera TaxID=50390 RepID=A0A6P7FW84_DIAVI
MNNHFGLPLNEVLNEIKRNRVEIKNAIEAAETRLMVEIADLKNKNYKLEEENKRLIQEVEQVNRHNNKNSIVIFGLHITGNQLTVKDICAHILSLVEIETKPSDINNFYTLGKKPNSPLRIDLVNYWMKVEILKNSFKLKEKPGIFISSVLTKKQQIEAKILRKHLLLAKQDKTENSYIKRGKLYVNNRVYAAEDLIDIEENNERLTNSAPATPTTEAKTCEEPTKHIPEVPKNHKEKPDIRDNPNGTPTSSKYTGKPFTRQQDQRNRNKSTSSTSSRK